MTDARYCIVCGSELSSRTPDGLCSDCLVRAAPTRADSALAGETVDLGRSSARETLAATFDDVPSVLLRDLDVPGEPAPIHQVRPGDSNAGGSSRYRIDGEIGRGGMGSVLKGRDADLGRDVALKVLRDDLRDRPDMVRRFIEEAQIGGQLQHPGIVPVYESGVFADNRPFFSMKLVRGRTLDDLLAARSSSADGLPRFLGVFEQIAQTVAYAHARGVIHRDLKPSNVMIGGFGEVQVMDWGLAKVLPRDGKTGRETVIATARSGDDDSDLDRSRAGSVMGTPSYMAPEQARGELELVDERADVFALGSILCEILTGAPAFVGGSALEIQRKAARGETADALARLDARETDAELIALARSCLAADRDDRPRDAGVLRDRITAHLAGVRERLRAAEIDRARAEALAVEERRRRRLQLGLAASLLTLTTLGGLTFTYELHQRQARAARADRLLSEARLLRDQALARREDVAGWERAGEAADRLVEEIGPSDALTALRREARDGLAAARGDRDLVARLTEIQSGRADDPDGSATNTAYAAAFRSIGIDPDQGDPADAGARIAARPAPVAAALVAALDDWANVRRGGGGGDAARVLAVARAADPDPDRDALRAALLIKDGVERLRRLRPLAERAGAESWSSTSLILLGNALAQAGDPNAGVAVLERNSWSHPEDARGHYELARLLGWAQPPRPEEVVRAYSAAWSRQPELAAQRLGNLLAQRGRREEAVAVLRDLVNRRPNNGYYLGAYGNALKSVGRDAEARAIFTREAALFREEVRLNPGHASNHDALAWALRQTDDLPGAIAECREAIRLSPGNAAAHDNLGAALRDSGDPAGALAAFREAARLNPGDVDAHLGIGDILVRSGDAAGAIAEFREAVRLSPGYSHAHLSLGAALHNSGDRSAAIAEFREAVRLDPSRVDMRNRLGWTLVESGDFPGAASEFREMVRLKPNDASNHDVLGWALRLAGDPAGAIAEGREAIRLNPNHVAAHNNLGAALRESGDISGAVAEFREAARLDPGNVDARLGLGDALDRSGDSTGAAVEFREAVRLGPGSAHAHLSLGVALHHSGDRPGAIAEFREAIRLEPNRVDIRDRLGWTLIEVGDLSDAASVFRETIRLKPDDADAQRGLAAALKPQERSAEAVPAE